MLLRRFAEENARLEFRQTRQATHYVRWDAPDVGYGRMRALCGELVHGSQHANEPTCQACQQAQEALDRMEF